MAISESLFRKASKGLIGALREVGYKTPAELAVEKGITPTVKADTTITKAQWDRLLKRVLLDEPVAAQRGLLPEREMQGMGQPGELSTRAFEQITQAAPPMNEQTLSPLRQIEREPIGTAEYGPPKYLPIEQARSNLLENPMEFMQGSVGPPVTQISQAAPASPLPEDIINSIAYNRLNFKPALSAQERASAGRLLGSQRAEDATSLLAGQGLAPEDIRTSPEAYLRSKGLETKERKLADVVKDVVKAEQIWKEGGGLRSQMGERWAMMLDDKKAVVKQLYKSPKDWFVACYNKWKENPYNFGKKYPAETRMLEKIGADVYLE